MNAGDAALQKTNFLNVSQTRKEIAQTGCGHKKKVEWHHLTKKSETEEITKEEMVRKRIFVGDNYMFSSEVKTEKFGGTQG